MSDIGDKDLDKQRELEREREFYNKQTDVTDLLVKDLDKQTEVTSDGQSGELEGKTGPLQTYNDPREKKSP